MLWRSPYEGLAFCKFIPMPGVDMGCTGHGEPSVGLASFQKGRRKMKELRTTLMMVILFAITIGCQNRADLEKEKSEIVKLLEFNDQALLKEDVNMMLSVYPEGVPLVGAGRVSKSTRAEGEQMWKNLFNNVDYNEAGDIEKPIIHISADGSMAWAIRQFRFNLSYRDSAGTKKSVEDLGAELSVYEKQNSQWVLVASAESHQQ